MARGKEGSEGGVAESVAGGGEVGVDGAVAEEVVRGQELTREMLSKDLIAGKGEFLKSVGAWLVAMPHLEQGKYIVPLPWIKPNPNQPREYFEEGEMAKIVRSLRLMGQRNPMITATIWTPGTDYCDLFIADGERRYRGLNILEKPAAVCSVERILTEEALFEESLVLNESFAAHNPIERAKAYEKLIQFKMARRGVVKTNAIIAIAERLAIHPNTIKRHLDLLELDPETQDAVMKGDVPVHAALARRAVRKRLGEQVHDRLFTARAMLDGLETSEDEDGGRGSTTLAGIRKTSRQLIIDRVLGRRESERETTEMMVAAQVAVSRLHEGLSSARRGVELMREANQLYLRGFLRGRNLVPPEALAGKIHEAVAALLGMEEWIREEVVPWGALEVLEGKPKYTDYIEQHKDTFGSSKGAGVSRYEMARIFCECSDEGGTRPLMSAEVAKKLGVDPGVVGSNLNKLAWEFGQTGIALEELYVRVEKERKSGGKRGMVSYDKVPAFRPLWVELVGVGIKLVRGRAEGGAGVDEGADKGKVGAGEDTEVDGKKKAGRRLGRAKAGEAAGDRFADVLKGIPEVGAAAGASEGADVAGDPYGDVLAQLDEICGVTNTSMLWRQILGEVCAGGMSGELVDYEDLRGKFRILDLVMQAMNRGNLGKHGFQIYLGAGEKIEIGFNVPEPAATRAQKGARRAARKAAAAAESATTSAAAGPAAKPVSKPEPSDDDDDEQTGGLGSDDDSGAVDGEWEYSFDEDSPYGVAYKNIDRICGKNNALRQVLQYIFEEYEDEEGFSGVNYEILFRRFPVFDEDMIESVNEKVLAASGLEMIVTGDDVLLLRFVSAKKSAVRPRAGAAKPAAAAGPEVAAKPAVAKPGAAGKAGAKPERSSLWDMLSRKQVAAAAAEEGAKPVPRPDPVGARRELEEFGRGSGRSSRLGGAEGGEKSKVYTVSASAASAGLGGYVGDEVVILTDRNMQGLTRDEYLERKRANEGRLGNGWVLVKTRVGKRTYAIPEKYLT